MDASAVPDPYPVLIVSLIEKLVSKVYARLDRSYNSKARFKLETEAGKVQYQRNVSSRGQ